MCDPVTMGVSAGLLSGGAAYAVGGTTIAGMAVGSVSIMQAATIGLTVGSSVMQAAAGAAANKQDRISAGLQERQYDEQAKRYKAQADAQALETKQRINQRKREYLSTLSSNMASMGASGATMQSASFQNLLRDNERTYRQDVSALGLMGTEARYESISQAQDSLTAKASVRPMLETKQKQRTYETAGAIFNQAKEIGNPFDTSKTKTKAPKNVFSGGGVNKMSVGAQRKLRNVYGY